MSLKRSAMDAFLDKAKRDFESAEEAAQNPRSQNPGSRSARVTSLPAVPNEEAIEAVRAHLRGDTFSLILVPYSNVVTTRRTGATKALDKYFLICDLNTVDPRGWAVCPKFKMEVARLINVF